MAQKIRFKGWSIDGEIEYEVINVIETPLFFEFEEDDEKVIVLKTESLIFDSVFDMAKFLEISNKFTPYQTKNKRLISINTILKDHKPT
jgi:hypothetical protein